MNKIIKFIGEWSADFCSERVVFMIVAFIGVMAFWTLVTPTIITILNFIWGH